MAALTPWLQDADVTLYHGDVLATLRELPAESVDCVVTSPPYWGLRDYGTGAWEGGDAECDHKGEPHRTQAGFNERYFGKPSQTDKQGDLREPYRDTCGKCGATRIDQQLGLEPTPEQYVERMVEVFREVRRVLAAHGTVWLNLGDSYNAGTSSDRINHTTKDPNDTRAKQFAERSSGRARMDVSGLKPKDLVGIPWRVAFALQADGWYLRADIVWSKPNPMPESVTDRPTKAHEMVFLLAKGQWKSRVVELANLNGERLKLGGDLGTDKAHMWARDIGIRLAAAILDSATGKDEFGVAALDLQVGHERLADLAREAVASLPSEQRPAMYAARFLMKDSSAKDFLCEIDRLGIALADGNDFRIGGGAPIPLPPGVNPYGDAAVAVHDSREIREFDFRSHTLKVSTPGGCSYFFDQEAVREPISERWIDSHYQYMNGNVDNYKDGKRDSPGIHGAINPAGRNIRSVWEIATQPYPEAHFATFPEELARRCISAGCPENGVVLDPFVGSGTVCFVARKLNRRSIGIDLNESYLELAARRLQQQSLFAVES